MEEHGPVIKEGRIAYKVLNICGKYLTFVVSQMCIKYSTFMDPQICIKVPDILEKYLRYVVS
jgi:hypothetical protein